MFRIADGREHFYQWDIDRQIQVEDSSIKELHFCNKTDTCSLVVKVVDGVANVPNVLLQTAWDIRVYGYTGDYTKVEKRFKVVARTKPTDYVYTETEILNYNTLLGYISTVSGRVGLAMENATQALNTANNVGHMAFTNKQTLDYVIEPNLATHEERLNAFEIQVGDIETALDSIITIQGTLVGTITFTCKELSGNINYTAIKDMTWEEWCNSPYNTQDRYYINGDKVMYAFGTPHRAVGTGTSASTYKTVLPTDKIIDGTTYRCDMAV
jgi:hypothetical protein